MRPPWNGSNRLAGARSDVLPFAILMIAAAALALLPTVSSATIGARNVYDILQTFANYGLLSLAVGLSMIIGEYDISTASMYGLGGMVAVLTGESSPLAGAAAGIGTGLAAGLLQGLVISRLRMSSVPVTLGGYIVILGATYVISNNNDVTYNNIGASLRLDQQIGTVFSIGSLVTIGGFLAAAMVFRFTRVGSAIRATGDDRRAAEIAGVRVSRILLGVFAVSGAGAAAAGLLNSYSLGSALPNVGFNPLVFATIAAILGGIRLAGGRGSPLGIAAGVLSLATLQEILGALAAPEYVGDLVTGGILVLVTIVAAPSMSDWWERRSVAVGARLAQRRSP